MGFRQRQGGTYTFQSASMSSFATAFCNGSFGIQASESNLQGLVSWESSAPERKSSMHSCSRSDCAAPCSTVLVETF